MSIETNPMSQYLRKSQYENYWTKVPSNIKEIIENQNMDTNAKREIIKNYLINEKFKDKKINIIYDESSSIIMQLKEGNKKYMIKVAVTPKALYSLIDEAKWDLDVIEENKGYLTTNKNIKELYKMSKEERENEIIPDGYFLKREVESKAKTLYDMLSTDNHPEYLKTAVNYLFFKDEEKLKEFNDIKKIEDKPILNVKGSLMDLLTTNLDPKTSSF